MPTRPPTRCNDPDCTTLTTTGRCDLHKRPPWANRTPKADRYDGISSGEWRALKAATARRDHDTCYMCGAEPDPDDPHPEAFVLDHKTPMAEGGAARNPDNLGLLCPACDAIKSAAEADRGRQRYLDRRRNRQT